MRTNGNPDYIGRSAVFDGSLLQKAGFEPGEFIYASYLIREGLMPIALTRISCSIICPRLTGEDKCGSGQGLGGAIQHKHRTNRRDSRSTPPLSLQREFAARVAEVRALEAKQVASRQRLDTYSNPCFIAPFGVSCDRLLARLLATHFASCGASIAFLVTLAVLTKKTLAAQASQR